MSKDSPNPPSPSCAVPRTEQCHSPECTLCQPEYPLQDGPNPSPYMATGVPPPLHGYYPMAGVPPYANYAYGYAGTAFPVAYPPGYTVTSGYQPGMYSPNVILPATEPDGTNYHREDVRTTAGDGRAGWEAFSDKAIRRAFIRKVYSILMIQLTFTTGVIVLFVFEPHVRMAVRTNKWMYTAAYVIFLVLYFVLVCCENVRRNWPTNVILLTLFTMALSYLVGVLSSYHDTHIVLMAMGICAACCLAITLFSFNTKYDITSCSGVLFILCIVLLIFGILTIFTHNRILVTIYAAFGALLFMLFLAFDTQMLMGGKKHQLSPEEYIYAALQLYLDIVYIFMYLLLLMDERK